MPKHFFLGQASHYTRAEVLAHTFSIGTAKSSRKLREFLTKKYQAKQVALTRNGRSALALALKAALPKNSEVIVNGFTCYAVLEAVKAAGMKPVFADIDTTTIHFNVKTLADTLEKHPDAEAMIIQNTFGITVDITAIEKFARQHNLKIFEDLAHCTGMLYQDGRMVGTVGVAAAMSFGKEKSIDTITGGALIVNDENLKIQAPTNRPKFGDSMRARFYPLFGAIYRTLSYIKLESVWMSFLIKTHQVERSANSRLDITERPAHFVAKRALKLFRKLPQNRPPIRQFVLVNFRDKALATLKEHGYYFDGFWFETPIAPERFYKLANFPEDECPVATMVAKSIINFPTHYSKSQLKLARKLIKEFEK